MTKTLQMTKINNSNDQTKLLTDTLKQQLIHAPINVTLNMTNTVWNFVAINVEI